MTVCRNASMQYSAEFLVHQEGLLGFAMRLTRNEEDALDLVQDTHLRALNYLDNYTAGTNARSWLFRIMYSLFINNYRRKKRSPFHDMDAADLEEIGKTCAVHPEIYRNSFSDEVMSAFNELKPEFKTAIYLRDFENLRYDEISRIIGVPLCTVKTRIHRARRLMKQMICRKKEAVLR